VPKIRWGPIGATVIGREWMIAAIREAGGDVVAVMSTDRARGRAYADEFRIPQAVTSLPDLFAAGIDAVYISTTNERHRAEPIAAAAHVLCGKPLAKRLSDAEEMVVACKRAGVVMATNRHLRNGAIARAMRDMIRGGRIGRPLAARVAHAGYLPEHLHGWRLKDPTAGAGAILDLTVHDADLLRFILDDEPEAVATFSKNGGLAAPGRRCSGQSGPLPVGRARSALRGVHDALCRNWGRGARRRRRLASARLHVQTPRGALVLRSVVGEEHIAVDHQNYLRARRPLLPRCYRGAGTAGGNRRGRSQNLGGCARRAGVRSNRALHADRAGRLDGPNRGHTAEGDQR
jgi:1,5-anhydro-D-fructose reductase (1,5-anhydro-D-mannitol-forming)